MSAIGAHHTATSDGGWDGPANEARLRKGEGAAYYRRAFAWQDPDGDPETKAGYRFIHHEVGSDGSIGAANLRACSTGIGVLNGGRGGTTIPDADKQGVYNHLAAHLRDGDMEPPELRAVEETIERRVAEGQMEVRAGEDGAQTLVGYASVFGQISDDLGGFREIVEPGAFRDSIANGADVRALWNHDSNLVLGRTRAGTLRLAEDEHGLRVEIDVPPAGWAQDMLVSVRRGDVSQMSFGFTVPDNGHTWGRLANGGALRSLRAVRLIDVSPVAFPAYPQTSLQVRSKAQALRQEPEDDGAGAEAGRARARLWRHRIEITEMEDI